MENMGMKVTVSGSTHGAVLRNITEIRCSLHTRPSRVIFGSDIHKDELTYVLAPCLKFTACLEEEIAEHFMASRPLSHAKFAAQETVMTRSLSDPTRLRPHEIIGGAHWDEDRQCWRYPLESKDGKASTALYYDESEIVGRIATD